MVAGVRGRLISAAFAQAQFAQVSGVTPPPTTFEADLDRWAHRVGSTLGPASSLRLVTDVAVIPLLRLLGFAIVSRADRGSSSLLEAEGGFETRLPVLTIPWDEALDQYWRDVVHHAIRSDARWCLCSNGQSLRVVDAHRTWSRRYIEFDLRLVATEKMARLLLWNLVRAEAMCARPTHLDVAAEGSARHGTAVCKALGTGVLEALTLLFGALSVARRSPSAEVIFEQSLTVLYRILFLLFAEARALVPVWHPVYRDRYTIDAILSTLLAGRRCRGVWEAILAISRLAHAGCRAGELRVPAFNGRLFSPAGTTAFDRTRVGDEVMGRTVLALGSTATERGGRGRISYADLDVEQLGAVYEQVLEYQPVPGTQASTPALVRTRDIRQSSGTFYTPRSVTAFLVRQALEPLVRDRGADDILRLRVLDPAMGSGAFLVAACRYLAGAVEQSLIREGRWHPGDVTTADRAALRREVAQRCLFGVDVNPMAVQLARLSLWLASLATDKPLTFLDHHLTVGDSLVGAGFDDVRRQPTRVTGTPRRHQPLSLFGEDELTPALEQAVGARSRMALQPDASAAIVAEKAKTLSALRAPTSPLGRWSRVLDLWCAGWFWEDTPRPTAAVFGALCDALLRARPTLPAHVGARYLEHARGVAARQRFFHWPIGFPEVFHDESGRPLHAPGFDAVIGNPPWDMVRGDSGSHDTRVGARQQAQRITSFVREAGVYKVESRSHVNRYQLFVERALQLTRAGGRIGLVLPSGFAADAGAAPLRRHVLDRASIDSLTGLDNRGRFFPIHRSLRFVLFTATAGTPTSSVSVRFGVTSAEELESPSRPPIVLRRDMLERLSGADDLAIPEVLSDRDLRILETISARTPWLSAADGWNVRFGRELNATDDRHLFVPFTGRAGATPVIEGKQLEPFRTDVSRCRYELARGVTRKGSARARVAYRDVASATNRLTLVAAVVPAHAVTTHTLFCLKTALPSSAQHVLSALLNSFAANYLVRLRVSTHVTASLVSRLPVPFVPPHHPAFRRLAQLARTLSRGNAAAEASSEYPELQAIAARLYGLSAADFEHVLGTFPLIPVSVRENALHAFQRHSLITNHRGTETQR